MRAPGTDWVYKILPWSDWEALDGADEWAGSEADLRAGFIRFSTAAQVAENARLHFAGAGELALLGVPANQVALTWEPSRGGEPSPHLYGPLPLDVIDVIERVAIGPEGHEFPWWLSLGYPPTD
ncbi:MAG: DUF952 domain-containing protein [Sandaracinaceae bacterium]|nr:MAG: DUF952 domain-containing protein [Sandaracinaceae bacterium]